MKIFFLLIGVFCALLWLAVKTLLGIGFLGPFAAGVYVSGAVATFFVTGFLVCLGGKDGQLLLPFLAGIFWPFAVCFYSIKRLARRKALRGDR